jgi:hypothetical protein
MADPAVVAALLFQRCESMVISAPTMPIAFPDVAFTAPTDGKYLRVDFFANAPAWESLSGDALSMGLLQISVVWPKGVGVVKPREVAHLVEAHFSKGLQMSGQGVRVKVSRKPWTASPIIEDTQTLTPVTIPWTAS